MTRDRLSVVWVIDHVCYDGSLHGGGRLYMNLLPAMLEHGIDVHPYFLRSSSEVKEVFESARSPVVSLDRGKFDPRGFLEMRSLLRRHQAQAMHLFCYQASTYGRILSALTGIPAVVHDFDTQVYFPYPLYLEVLDRLLASKSAHAFAASQMCRQYMNQTRRIPHDRISLFFHVIPEEVWAQADQPLRSSVRQRLGIAADATVFCCVTKLGPERGNETLLEAMRQVVNHDPGARLILIHKPTRYHVVPDAYKDIPWVSDADHMRQQIQTSVRDLELEQNVVLIESLDQPWEFMAASDVLVAPFESERFSSVNLVEGLAFSLPGIVTHLGEAREVIRDQREGLHVEPSNSSQLAAAMRRLLDAPARRTLANAARERAAYFSLDSTAERLAQTYRDITARGGSKT